MPLTAIEDFKEKGMADPVFEKLAQLCPAGLWTREAEEYLLAHATPISV